MVIFKQNDFTGGLDRQMDAAKSPENAYPLLVNARTRQNVVSPVFKHKKIDVPDGNYQGLYAAGQYLVLFVSGLAYYADITQSYIHFLPVANWTPMDEDVSRIYAEVVPATANFFNRTGEPLDTNIAFNGTIKAFSQALFCFDGVEGHRAQAILPDGTARQLKNYNEWTKDNPEYVPMGVVPTVAGNKLFLASPDRLRVLHSVTGRCSDFVINLDVAGEKGGDADTVSQTVSYNRITALKALSTSQVLVCTLYGSFILDFDYDRAQFGEPYLRPVYLFPTGALNELSIVDILADTALITQSGIHSFNAVAQAKRESNNFPLGAKIRGLLNNPQADTCCGFHDDYAYFAVNTIYGYGAIVYDTTTGNFQSLDLAFGRVKQFATTKQSGSERMFFITHDNQIFEAFSDSVKAPARVYLGEFTPDEAPKTALVDIVNVIFANVKSSGTVKMTVFTDNEEFDSVALQCTKNDYSFNPPIPVPFVKSNQVFSPEWQMKGRSRGWRTGLLVEWDFDGDLTDMSLDGEIDKGPTVVDNPQVKADEPDVVAFFGSSGYIGELNTGGNFPTEEYVEIEVEQGEYYAYDANGNGILLNGNEQVTRGIFKAKIDAVQVRGVGPKTFTLRKATEYIKVLNAIYDAKISRILHGGNFGYPAGTQLDVTLAKLPIRVRIDPAVGPIDLTTSDGTYFFNFMGVPNYYHKALEFVDFFFYNSDITAPQGFDETSIQAAACRNWAANSTKPFKIVIIPDPPYSTDTNIWPGRTDMRFMASYGISAVISGCGRLMERFDINGLPYLSCGAGGQELAEIEPETQTTVAWRDNEHHGYLKITADALACRFTFHDTDGNELDQFEISA